MSHPSSHQNTEDIEGAKLTQSKCNQLKAGSGDTTTYAKTMNNSSTPNLFSPNETLTGF